MLIRDLREYELDFLRDMLYAALAWRPGVDLPPLVYERLGYVELEPGEETGRMNLELA